MDRQPKRTYWRSTARASVHYLFWLAVFVTLVVTFRWLPKAYVDEIVPAATVSLFFATGGLVAATWFYARRTDESLKVMKQQTRAVELQVAAADKQRRATIRPVIFFRNDFADPDSVVRYEEGMQLWQRQYDRWKVSSSSPQKSEAPPGEKPNPPGASVVNEGNGVALNVRAWALSADGKRLSEQAASIGVRGSHFVKGWHEDLRAGAVIVSFSATYQDAEGTYYYTAVRGMPTEGTWRVGEGPLPAEFEIAE